MLRARGFTLLEMLLSTVVIAILVLAMTEVLQHMEGVFARSRSQLEHFQAARAGLDAITRRVSQATLNGYWGYVYKSGTGGNPDPTHHDRQSDMHFVSGAQSALLPGVAAPGHAVFFQAQLGESDTSGAVGLRVSGMQELVNCMGFYVDYVSDEAARPAFLAADTVRNPIRKRFRLLEFRLPTEESVLYSSALNLNAETSREKAYAWFRGPFRTGTGTTQAHSHPLADNILALIVIPRVLVTSTDAAGNSTTVVADMKDLASCDYDTRAFQWTALTTATGATKHQLPPLLGVTLIATDEPSYQRLELRLGEDATATAVREAFKDRFVKPAEFAVDLAAVEQALTALPLTIKTVSTTVALRASKWITEKETP